MTSQWVERTWIHTGGYRWFRGEWVKLISLYKNKADIICKFDGEVAKSLGE